MLSKKQTIFCGNSNLNVQNINSCSNVVCLIVEPSAGKCLYSSGGSGLKKNLFGRQLHFV